MSQQKSPGYLWSVLTCKCPRCRQGDMFKEKNPYKLKTCMKMNSLCPVCKQPTEIEVGFYYGTGYVSYALALMVCGISFAAWWLLIGFSLDDSRFFWWLGFNAVLLAAMQPYLMRLSRSMWLSFFVRYDPFWKDHAIDDKHMDRIVPEQMGNW
ncbi:DUF983 domain-containing protein [Parasegetibacter sp. MAH-26]|uniref:DUF983 domain-containing protein n=2 Tax=Pinibacter aurantiacus TaxID=2851599 RepID=A0A9E2SB32_9BACT|nr:DUF983 domain-containing protein [Pinibacter aurantiacus]MBV4356605.1 DUF983 domain-containing protein [Pinibacter aurantiacus]